MNLWKPAMTFLKKNAPAILTGAACVGTIVTAIFSAKATPTALKLIEEAKQEKRDELTTAEKIKAGWRPYIPAGASGLATMACMIGATVLGHRHEAALMSVITAGECLASDYRNEVKKALGEDKERDIHNAAVEHRMEQALTCTGGLGIIDTGHGDELFYDDWSGRFFKSSMTSILEGVAKFNVGLHSLGYSSMNEFYGLDEINLPLIDSGRDVGYKEDYPMKVDFYHESRGLYKCLTYDNPPKSDFDN